MIESSIEKHAPPEGSRADSIAELTWINAACLPWLGSSRSAIGAMAERLAGAVGTAGLREYYDPYTGEGMGAEHFSWSALIPQLLGPDARTATSFIE